MRVAIRGNPNTDDLAKALRKLIARFQAIGIEMFRGVNIYLNPHIESEELVLVDKDGSIVDVLELVPEIEGDGVVYIAPNGQDVAIVRKTDVRRVELLRRFVRLTNMPDGVVCKLLGITEQRLITLATTWVGRELSEEERSTLTVIGRMLEAAEEIFPDEVSMIQWFRGPFPHSELAGQSPIEQIFLTDIVGVSKIATALEWIAKSKLLGFPITVPPRHYDLAVGSLLYGTATRN